MLVLAEAMYLCRTVGERLRMHSGCFCYKNNKVWFWKEHGLEKNAHNTTSANGTITSTPKTRSSPSNRRPLGRVWVDTAILHAPFGPASTATLRSGRQWPGNLPTRMVATSSTNNPRTTTGRATHTPGSSQPSHAGLTNGTLCQAHLHNHSVGPWFDLPRSPLPTLPSSPPSISPAPVRAQLSVPSRPRSFRRPPRSLPTSRCSAKPSWPVGKSSRESLPGSWCPGHPVRQPANRSHSKWHSHPPRSTAGCQHYLSILSHKQRRPPPPRRPVPWGSIHRNPQTQREGMPAYPELVHTGRCRLIVLGVEVGGRFSNEAANLVRSLAQSHAGGQFGHMRPCTPSHPASS